MCVWGGGGVHTLSLVNTYMYTYHVCMKAIITNTAAGELPVPYTSTAGELPVSYTSTAGELPVPYTIQYQASTV